MTIAGNGVPVPQAEVLLQRVAGMIAGARALPLSSSVKLDNKDEILELLREASERLPEELRQARWMLKERDEYLAATQRKSDELVESARSEAQRLVQRTEILKEAQVQARHTLEQAREEARRMRLEAEDYADQKLAQFEIVLERTLKTVASGRQKLAGPPEREEDHPVTAAPAPVAPLPVASLPVASAQAGPPGGDNWRPPVGGRPTVRPVGPAGPFAPDTGPGRAVSGFTILGTTAAVGEGADDGSSTDDGIFDQDSLD